jgi:hypothetical protein
MSQNNETFNPFDPTGLFKELRDANLDSLAKMMIQLVNTDAYAQATAVALDQWLAASAPLRQVMEKVMAQVLANAQMPSRADVISLAQRLTNIEMRLDDLEALLEELRRPAKSSGPKARPSPAENKS